MMLLVPLYPCSYCSRTVVVLYCTVLVRVLVPYTSTCTASYPHPARTRTACLRYVSRTVLSYTYQGGGRAEYGFVSTRTRVGHLLSPMLLAVASTSTWQYEYLSYSKYRLVVYGTVRYCSSRLMSSTRTRTVFVPLLLANNMAMEARTVQYSYSYK